MNYLKGTIEFIGVNLTVDGEPATTGVQLAVVSPGATIDTATWGAPQELEGKIGVLLTGTETPGSHRIYAKITDSPEIPIVFCGSFFIHTA